MLAPATEEDLKATIVEAKVPLVLHGLGTKTNLGRIGGSAEVLSLKKFAGVTLYEAAELVIEAGAATPLDEIEALVDGQGQRLAFEPPDYAKLLGQAHRGSIGSVLACNLSGPRRLTAGAARDHILGIRGVAGRGEIFKAGGRVVKNVTGYDIAKLMAGSFGTLAALTSVTFKVLPKAETEVTLLARDVNLIEAGALMRQAMQLPNDVSCAAYVPGIGAGLRLEGIYRSVMDRKQALLKTVPCELDVVDDVASKQFWKDVRDVSMFTHDRSKSIWRISVAPTEGPELARRLCEETGGACLLDWAGGLIWFETAAAAGIVRMRIKSGHALLFRAADGTSDAGPNVPSALAALSKRVKLAFDPRGVLNPGRLNGGW